MSNRSPLKRTEFGQTRRIGALILALACVGWGIDVQSAAGQAFQFKPELKKSKFEVDQLLRNGTEIPIRQQEMFDNFFNFFILPPMAMPNRSHELPAVRTEIRKYFLTGKIGVPYNQLNELVRTYMKTVVAKVKSPVAKYNAVLVIGDLNEFEGGTDDKGGGKLPKPLPAALEDLIKLLKDAQQPEYIRVAAMVGVRRHAANATSFPLENATKVEITTAMLDLLNQKEVPKGYTPGAHGYLRRMAGEALAALGSVGKNGENFTAVVAAADNTEASNSMRLGLSAALGQFKYDGGEKLNLLSATGAIGRAAIDASQAELKRTDALNAVADKPLDPDRRRLSYFFRQAQLGLFGPRGNTGLVDASEGTPAGPTIAVVGDKVNTILKDLQAAPFIDSQEFSSKLADLEQALPKRADAGKVPAGVAKKAGPVSSTKKVPAVPANR